MAKDSVGILATGSYLPKDEVTNADLADRAGVTSEWIERKTEIRSRRYAAPTEATSDLAARAAEEALAGAGLPADRLRYLIVSTSTGDSPQPPTANLVQHAIGAYQAACFDINVVCSGFVYGLELARCLVAGYPGSYALVVAAEVYSRFLDFSDRRTAVLLGDGAGAAVVGPTEPDAGFLGFALHSRGDAHHLIRVEAGGSRLPATHETVERGAHLFTMDGRRVRDFVLDSLPGALAGLAADAGIGLDRVDHFVPHQPNGVLLRELVDRCGLADAVTHRTLESYGNVGSASVAVTLDAANRSGRLAPGDLVLLAAFGGGMSIGASLLRWSGEPA